MYKNNFELAAIMGLNYKFNDDYDLGIRYNRGISSILDLKVFSSGDPQDDYNEYNTYFEFYIRLYFIQVSNR